jgi:hypothetical protein
MLTAIIILACCCSLIGSLSIGPISNEKHIDGSQHTIKSIDTTYTQRVSDQGMYKR